MGLNASNQSNKSITNIVNNSMNKISVDVKNSVIAVTKSTNNIVIDISGVKSTGNFNVTQINDVATKAILTADVQMINELATQINNKVADELEAELAQTNEDLNIGQANISNQDQLIVKNVTNNLVNDIRTGIENTVTVETDASQTIRITIKNSQFKNINIDQRSLVRAVAQNISKAISDTCQDAMLDTEATAKIKAAVEQKNKGLDIMAFFTTLAIGLVLLGGIIIFIKYGGSSKSSQAKSDDTQPDAFGGGSGPNIVIGVIVLLIIILGAQFYIHYQYTILKTSPITGKMVTDPPFTVFSLLNIDLS